MSKIVTVWTNDNGRCAHLHISAVGVAAPRGQSPASQARSSPLNVDSNW